MTDAQQRASDPNFHVWVAASAGSGKTKVLTDRVLRLLLSGTAPHRILCLTYTNAAAMEMRARLQKKLTQWAVQPEGELKSELEKLNGASIDRRQLTRARRLFAQVLDAPEGVRIQTVHAFCQSLLKRFPLEAGIAPQMELLTDRAQKTLLKEARHRLLTSPRMREPLMQDAMRVLAAEAQAETLESLLDGLISNRRRFRDVDAHDPVASVIEGVYAHLNVAPQTDAASLTATYLSHSPAERADLQRLRAACDAGKTKGAQSTAALIAGWLSGDDTDARGYAHYWLTKEGMPKQLSSIVPKAVVEALPDAEQIVQAEQTRALAFFAAHSAWRTATRTVALLRLFGAMLQSYAELKNQRAALDYDDLILRTLMLLNEPGMSAWVLFKLDGGIDHILVDEAQDTAQEQWEIVQLLTGEFFSGESANARPRSLFVVGDEKQSIYRFQGAQPEIFDDMRAHFQRESERVSAQFERVRLMRSFRSAPAVLAAVDAVFAHADAKSGLDVSESIIQHEAHRSGAAGLVEIWPLTIVPQSAEEEVSAEEDESDISVAMNAAGQWVEAAPKPRPDLLHAKLLAQTIAHWLQSKRVLTSQSRPVEPGDIMLLVRKRGPFVDALVRQLKACQVPVAGADRLELNAQLAVKDVLAILDVCLLPEDELTLAAALRSPILNLSEEALYSIAQGRSEGQGKVPLLTRLRLAAEDTKHPHHAVCASAHAALTHWMHQVDYQPPYVLLADILYRGQGLLKLQKRLGPQVIDPILELMQQALEFGQEECASLQGFMAWMRAGKTEIKRDMEQGQNEVRILTVHGSKGLQAPIVILADTLNMQSQTDALVWDAAASMALPLWAADAKFNPSLQNAKDAEKAAENRERNRQLYVAMTRAEDELYVTGWLPITKKNVDGSWYGLVQMGMESMDGIEAFPFADAFPHLPSELIAQLQPNEHGVPMLQRYANAQTELPHAKELHWQTKTQSRVTLPAWVHTAPPGEPTPPRPLTPSQLEQPTTVASPAAATDAMRRGQMVHGLLQWLPEVAADAREARGRDWLKLSARDLSAQVQAALLAQVLMILAEPAFASVFAAGSLAEVPISGLIEDTNGITRVINAQVDRLFVGADKIQVMDYKTTQNPPASVSAVPMAHLRQMAAYRALLARIYPGKTVECALVYTQGPALMILPDDALNTAEAGFIRATSSAA